MYYLAINSSRITLLVKFLVRIIVSFIDLFLCVGQRNQLSQEVNMWELAIEKLESDLRDAGKAELVMRSKDLLELVRQAHLQSTSSFVTTPVPADFTRSVCSLSSRCPAMN